MVVKINLLNSVSRVFTSVLDGRDKSGILMGSGIRSRAIFLEGTARETGRKKLRRWILNVISLKSRTTHRYIVCKNPRQATACLCSFAALLSTKSSRYLASLRFPPANYKLPEDSQDCTGPVRSRCLPSAPPLPAPPPPLLRPDTLVFSL